MSKQLRRRNQSMNKRIKKRTSNQLETKDDMGRGLGTQTRLLRRAQIRGNHGVAQWRVWKASGTLLRCKGTASVDISSEAE